MEIKKEKNNSFARFLACNLREKISKRKKTKWLILAVVLFFVLAGITLGSIYYGMVLFKTGAAVNMKEFILDLKERPKIAPNFFSGLFSNPEKIAIDIKFKDYQTLSQKRNEALRLGFLYASSDDFVPASIRYKDKIIKAEIRLKGDNSDHWADKIKWSFRIKFQGGETLFGMNQFSIQLPGTRAYLSEWLLHKMLSSLGLAHLRYDFIDITLNGSHLGIYALEEFFDKRLIENSQYVEGPIIRFDETLLWYRELPQDDSDEIYSAGAVDDFGSNKNKNDENLSKLLLQAKNLLESFRRGILPTHKVFDIEKLAKFFAVIDLTGNHHATEFFNMRFYYNPVTSLLEPIGFGNEEWVPSQYLESEVGDKQLELFYPIQTKYLNFKNTFFQDKEFFRAYIAALEEVSQKEFLDKFFSQVDKELNDKLRILYRSFPGYKFRGKEILYKNQEYIKVILNPVEALQASYKSFYSADSQLNLQLGNAQSLPVEVIGVSFQGKTFLPKEEIILQPKKIHQPIDFQEAAFKTETGFVFSKPLLNEMKVQYRILGLGDIRTQSIIEWPYFDEKFLETDLMRQTPNWQMFSFLETDLFSKVIHIKPGFWNIKQNLILPPGFTVTADKGTTLNLSNKAIILSYSPLRFLGEEDSPILIESLNKTGHGLVVLNAKEKSILSHVFFKDLSAPVSGNWSMTGAINFYQSPVDISFCRFEENLTGDDNLHLIRTQANIFDSIFANSLSDNIDADFVQGKIARTSFYGCGLKDNNGDCLDLSGSSIILEDVSINKAGDKGISIGEGTEVSGDKIKIQTAGIGIASKDKSKANFTNVSISDSKIGLAVYEKKPEFGPAELLIEHLNQINVSQLYLVEEGSTMIVDNKAIKPNDKNVAEKLYGK